MADPHFRRVAMGIRRTRCAVFTAVLATATVADVRSTRAADFIWNSASAAQFSSPASWAPTANAPPKTADRAVFDGMVPSFESRLVDFNFSPTNDRLVVKSDDVTFRLGSRRYQLTNGVAGSPSIVVAESAGQVSDLRFENGFVDSVNSTLGLAGDSDAIVQVNGTTWTNSQTMIVGAAGTGEIQLEAGGVLNSRYTSLADQGSGYGILSATGTGARLSNSEHIIVGNFGYGSLSIAAGATASNTLAIVGSDLHATGTVTVTGENSKWTNSGTLTIGDAGYGDLTIEDGGFVSSNGARIAAQEGSTGVVTAYNGTWANTGDIQIGGSPAGPGGTGTLVVDFGAIVSTTGTTRVREGGLLSIRGGEFETGTLVNEGGIEYIVGVLHLTASDLLVGDSGVLGSVLALSPDMHTIVDQHTTVDATGKIAVIQGSFTSSTITNQGRLSIVDGAMAFSGPSTNATGGRISVIEGTLATGTGANRFTNSGRMDLIDAVVNGDLQNGPGTILTTGGAVTFNGAVTGNATFTGGGTVTFNGRFEPSATPTAVNFGGDLAFGDDATLALQIGGTLAGSQYDQVKVGGSALLDGDLLVTLVSNFVPAAGQSFALMPYGNHTGAFDATTLPTLPAALTWSLNYSASGLTLSVIGSAPSGDLNHDGTVNRGDLRLLLANYGKSTGALAAQGDLNGDGRVNMNDLMALRSQMTAAGSPSASPAAVPEPATWLLAVAGIAALGARGARCSARGARRRIVD
jgi:T5SS/PEP-CTERM-associated repeat protein